MLGRIALRNVFRSKGKTLVTMTLITLSTVVLGTFISLLVGTFNKMYDNAIELYPGYIQVSTPMYVQKPHFDYLLDNTLALETKLSQEPMLAVVTSRIESLFLFSTKENSLGGMLVGVQPSLEVQSTKLAQSIIQGRYLDDEDTSGVVLGVGLAQKLQVRIGDTVSIIGSDLEGSFAAENLKVVGIFQTAVDTLDHAMAQVNRTFLDALIGTHDLSSYIIITPKDKDTSERVAHHLSQKYGNADVRIVDWHTHLHDLIEGLELIRISRYALIYFFIAIIFAVIAIFAVLMILSRKREVGVMRALGTTPWQIVAILLIERIILTLASIFLGLIIAGFLAYWLEVSPIYMDSMADMVHRIGIMEFVFQAKFSWAILVQSGVTIFVLSLITVLYPIWHISRLKPIEAIHNP